ncbi:MAG TPA: AAA family ATPase [Candidatus Magasanikbacteria bacterium]|nr:AAA family ATPase [Candidatus Magasanikbacteria bacterium]
MPQNATFNTPLAERMRPQTMDGFVGQEEIVGPKTVLRNLIENGQLNSIILWGPPGSGKTTLAHIIAQTTKADFIGLSAVMAGKDALREAIERAEQNKRLGQKTIVFLDEIHRWNKAQQDALLPHVEKGSIILIGATTENPSFEINSAVLSRSRVFVLKALTSQNIEALITQALKDKENGLGQENIKLEPEALTFITELSYGDGRVALNTLEMAAMSTAPNKKGQRIITLQIAEQARQHKALLYDKAGDEHYNIISALHKSMRGSDPNASLYWLARMLEAGEDPLYIARRVIRFASEDVGNASPYGLSLAVAAFQTAHMLGMPECNLALAQAVDYLARAKKSNALYAAYGKARKDVQEFGPLPVPLHLRNAPTQLMKDLNYGKDYIYNPNVQGPVQQTYLPDKLKGREYFTKQQGETWKDYE